MLIPSPRNTPQNRTNQTIHRGPYTGIGYLKTNQLGLKCTAATTCTLPAPTILNGYINAGPGIPHTSYIRSCTLNSFNLTSLTLQSYEITATKTASFSLYNHGAGDNYHISGVALQDDGAWHDCSPPAGLPWQLNSCRYSLKGREQIAFKIQWDCDDRDPLHPYVSLFCSPQRSLQILRRPTS